MSDEIGVQLVHSLNKKHSLVSGRAGLKEVNFFVAALRGGSVLHTLCCITQMV
jgi:hypothetical protein